MKKVFLVALVLCHTYAWAGIDWGILGFPSYNNLAKESISKFAVSKNGKLSYVFSMQKPSSVQTSPSQFSELLRGWDAKGDWQTSRGTLQVLWQRTGVETPSQGWPSVKKAGPTLEEIMLMYPGLPD